LTLDKLGAGCKGVVTRLDLPEDALRRMAAFGLVPGCRFNLTRIAPLGGPLVLQIGTTRFLLRRSLARAVEVEDRA
jgi:ferrous iron transport protein A